MNLCNTSSRNTRPDMNTQRMLRYICKLYMYTLLVHAPFRVYIDLNSSFICEYNIMHISRLRVLSKAYPDVSACSHILVQTVLDTFACPPKTLSFLIDCRQRIFNSKHLTGCMTSLRNSILYFLSSTCICNLNDPNSVVRLSNCLDFFCR